MQFLGNTASAAYLLFFILIGIRYAACLLPRENRLVRVAFGVTLALFAQMWLPALLAFLFSFTLWVQIASLVLFAFPLIFLRKTKPESHPCDKLSVKLHFFCVVPAMLLCAYLLHTHILRPVDGSLHTGQSCYGDMAMHLSFISSIISLKIASP